MPSGWAFEAGMVMFNSYNRFQRQDTLLQQHRLTIGLEIEELERDTDTDHSARIQFLDQESRDLRERLETNRIRWMDTYGNDTVHDFVVEGNGKIADSLAKGIVPSTYPLGVSSKTLPLLDLTLNTVWYNLLVLLIGFLMIAAVNLALLKICL